MLVAPKNCIVENISPRSVDQRTLSNINGVCRHKSLDDNRIRKKLVPGSLLERFIV